MKYRITNSLAFNNNYQNTNMVAGICPFCGDSCGFKTNGSKSKQTIPLMCDGCGKNVIWDNEQSLILPVAKEKALKGLPEEIDCYYQEALNCIAAQSPNGAATLFRKLIHMTGIYYGVAKVNDDQTLMTIVENLEKEGHINKKLVEALRRIKDLGNDGAHVNKNEPDMDQIDIIKNLIDNFLESTVLQDANIAKFDSTRIQAQES